MPGSLSGVKSRCPQSPAAENAAPVPAQAPSLGAKEWKPSAQRRLPWERSPRGPAGASGLAASCSMDATEIPCADRKAPRLQPRPSGTPQCVFNSSGAQVHLECGVTMRTW